MTWLLAIPGRLKLWGLAIGAGVIALASIWFGGRKAGKTAAKIETLKDEVKAKVLAAHLGQEVEPEHGSSEAQ
jgi:hypothetical protein